MSFQLVLAVVGAVMVICAALLFTDGGSASRKLNERVLATREVKTQQPAAVDAMLAAESSRGLFLRLASWLGYRSDLPAGYAASPKIVGPVAAMVGVGALNLSKHVISPTPAICLSIGIALLFARYLFRRKSKAYTATLFRQIPDAMSLMLRAVRAGLPVAEAIRSVGRESMAPTQEEFARVAGETALGMPVEVAIRRLAERTEIQEYAFFAVIIGLHAQTGGNLSETLENLADMVRRRVAMAAKSKALSAEGRLSAGVIAALPFVVGLLTFAFTPAYLTEFVVNPNGPMLIGVFAGLLCTGLFVSHLMIQRSMED
jgi:tight adherence protein B